MAETDARLSTTTVALQVDAGYHKKDATVGCLPAAADLERARP